MTALTAYELVLACERARYSHDLELKNQALDTVRRTLGAAIREVLTPAAAKADAAASENE